MGGHEPSSLEVPHTRIVVLATICSRILAAEGIGEEVRLAAALATLSEASLDSPDHLKAQNALAAPSFVTRSTDGNALWDELEIAVLQCEAEADVLLDPAFPADPFAP
jgi:hypothetical protein